VAERWVVNASPLILLAKAEIIHLLPRLCDQLVIPAGVVGEVRNFPISDPGAGWLASDGLRFIQEVGPLHPVLAGWRGGDGEGEVISWALHNRGFIAILDDRRARAFAAQNGVSVLGSLRIIVLAKEHGLIAAAKPALEKLRGAGGWVSEELLQKAIELAGES
jgi:predicted nucleic acid-binding protein